MEEDRKNLFSNQENIPFMEKFMVPQLYELFKFGGGSVKDGEREIERMLQYFSGYFTEDQLQANMERYNLQNMFAVVKEYFKKEYGYEGNEITLSNCY